MDIILDELVYLYQIVKPNIKILGVNGVSGLVDTETGFNKFFLTWLNNVSFKSTIKNNIPLS